MKLPSKFVFSLSALIVLTVSHPALANSQNYNGSSDGNTNFNNAVASGTLSVSDNGTGGVIFSMLLGSGQTNFGGGNSFVLYIDTGVGGGISTTSTLTDSADGARKAVSEFTATDNGGGAGRSTLNFNGALTPEFGINFDTGFADVFSLSNPSNFNFIDGAAANGSAGTNGATYTISGNLFTLNLPASDLSLAPFSGGTLNFFGIEVSQSGYSSTEVIGTSTGSGGWGSTQTVSSGDVFTLAVPEASSVGLVACGLGMLLLIGKRMRLHRA